MPRYKYECEDCGSRFTVNHRMSEDWEYCTECHSPNIDRVFNLDFNRKKTELTERQQVAKERIEKMIKENKEEVREMKKDTERILE